MKTLRLTIVVQAEQDVTLDALRRAIKDALPKETRTHSFDVYRSDKGGHVELKGDIYWKTVCLIQGPAR